MTTHTQDHGPTIRLVVCEEQALVVAGIRTLLAGSSEIRLVGEAQDADQAIALTRARRPDVVMLGLPLAGGELLSTVAQLRAGGDPGPPAVLVMAASSDEGDLLDALRAGVRGVVSRNCSGADLMRDVCAVAGGTTVLTPSMASQLVHFASGTEPTPALAAIAGLTPREAQVLTLVAQGLSDSAIANVLWVSKVTVRSHIHRTVAKLGMTSRAQAVAYYYQNGLFRGTRRASETSPGRVVPRVRPAAG